MIDIELTPEEKAYTAGYMAAERNYLEFMRNKISDVNEFLKFTDDIRDSSYDSYIASMAEYFDKDGIQGSPQS